MSDVKCSSCGGSNSSELVYCSACGALLGRIGAPLSGTAAAAAHIKRGSIGSSAESAPRGGLLSRLHRILSYLVLVAVGVLIVLALMDPGTPLPQEQRVSNPSAIVQRVFAASRNTPAALSQPVINSLLALQKPFAPESPVRLIPMPVWENARVQLTQGSVTLHVTMTLLGRPVRISETFRLKGVPGAWSFEPQSASVGMIKIPTFMLPVATLLVRPGILPLSKELEVLQTARSLVITPGLIQLITP
jgi:hypothetical protein